MESVHGTSVERSVIDLFPAGILIFNPDGSTHTINRSAQAIVRSFCAPELIRTWDDFLLFFNIEPPQEGAEPARIEKTVGDKTYILYPQNHSVGGEALRMAYIADITQEKQLIQEIRKSTSSILIGIRTRVTGVQNALGLIIDYDLPPGESAGLIRDSCYEIWLLARHADNLKDLSLSQAGALADALYIQPLSLSRLVKEALSNTAIFRNHHKNQIPIRISVPDTLTVRCDRPRMVKVIESILLNSFIYAGPGNQIDIDATIEDSWVILTIRDRGFGIPMEDQQRIFEYRFRGTNKDKVKYNGMGIELYLAKLNCSYQDATLSFSSKKDEGACFEIAVRRDGSSSDGTAR